MKRELFEELLQSVREMQEIEAGRLKPARVTSAADLFQDDVQDIVALRRRFRLSQVKFAALIGISVATLQNWEQGRREPDGPARVLLRVAAAHPEALLDLAARPSKRGSSRARRGRARSGQAP